MILTSKNDFSMEKKFAKLKINKFRLLDFYDKFQ
jgi:hypothetical protein